VVSVRVAKATTVANQRRCSAVDAYPRPHLASRRVTLLTGKTVVRILVENKRAVGVELMDQGLETIMAGEVVLLASTVHSPTILMHSGIGLAEQLRQRGIAVIVDARLKSGSIADSCRGAHLSGGLSHRRPKIIVDQVPPESIRAAAHDIACRASEVHVLAVGTCAIN
jgi:choline dehydrogenase-like flavoprotein